jgi:hypothetical protein
MPKAGRYDYPTRTLDDCVDALRKAWEGAKSYVQPRDSFANAIKMSGKSGSFNQLVGSMAMFGLVETGGGEIRWTETAKQIVHGKGDEVTKAKEQATRRIMLFGDVFDKFGANFSDDNLRLFLKDNATADIAEANSLAPVVGKLLKRHTQYLTPTKSGGGETDNMQSGTGSTGDTGKPPTPSSGYTDYNLGDLGLVRVSKEDSITKWEKMKAALDIIIGTNQPNQPKDKKDKSS